MDNRYKNNSPIVIKNGKVIPDNLNDCFLQRDLLCREFKYVARISRAIYSNIEEEGYKEFCDEMMEQMMEKRVDSILLKYGKKRDCVNLNPKTNKQPLKTDEKLEEENRDKIKEIDITKDVKNITSEDLLLTDNLPDTLKIPWVECLKKNLKKKKNYSSAKNKLKPVKKKKI